MVLALLWLALPVPIGRDDENLTSADCLTVGDRAGGAPATPRPVLERCSAMLETDTDLLTELAAIYEAAGEMTKAEAAYADALRIDPGLAEAHVRLARLLLRRGAARDARGHADAALAIQPNRRVVVALRDEAMRAEHAP